METPGGKAGITFGPGGLFLGPNQGLRNLFGLTGIKLFLGTPFLPFVEKVFSTRAGESVALEKRGGNFLGTFPFFFPFNPKNPGIGLAILSYRFGVGNTRFGRDLATRFQNFQRGKPRGKVNPY